MSAFGSLIQETQGQEIYALQKFDIPLSEPSCLRVLALCSICRRRCRLMSAAQINNLAEEFWDEFQL